MKYSILAVMAVLALAAVGFADSTTIASDTLIPQHNNTVVIAKELQGCAWSIYPNGLAADSAIKYNDIIRVRYQWRRPGTVQAFFLDSLIIIRPKTRGIDTLFGNGFRPHFTVDFLPR